MAIRKFYIGSVGPLLYDDTKLTTDPAFGGLPFHSFIAESQARILQTPSADDEVIRYQDLLLGGLFPIIDLDVTDSPYDVGLYDHYLNVDASAGDVTLNFPSAVLTQSNSWHVRKIDSSANTVTLVPNGAETINGAASKVIAFQWTSIHVVSDGTNLGII